MRGLVVILLAANLALLAWSHLTREAALPVAAPPLPAQPLILAGEIPASPPPSARTDLDMGTPSAVSGPVAPLTCQALGPFMERDAAARASRTLSATGLNPEMREVDTSHRLGFWVFIPPVAERAEATVSIDQLRQAGIRDYYLVADGEHANAVSLGVFSTNEAATQHASRLRGLGFEVEIGERVRQISAWWLDFVAPGHGSEAAASVAKLVLESDEALMLDAKPCR